MRKIFSRILRTFQFLLYLSLIEVSSERFGVMLYEKQVINLLLYFAAYIISLLATFSSLEKFYHFVEGKVKSNVVKEKEEIL